MAMPDNPAFTKIARMTLSRWRSRCMGAAWAASFATAVIRGGTMIAEPEKLKARWRK